MPTQPPISTDIALRRIEPRDHARLLALNAADVALLSPLDDASLAALLAEADVACVAMTGDAIAGFVIALREGRAYASPNYRWFDGCYPRFLYVDRVVVDRMHRGRGVAQALYAEVFAHARAAGVGTVACEYDIEPANPASARFHSAQGFREVGTQRLGAGKVVSLQAADAS